MPGDWVARALDAAHDVLFFITREGEIVDVVGATERLYGEEPSAMRGRPITDYHPGTAARERVEALMQRVIREGGCTFETVHRRRDGRLLPVEVSSRFITHRGRPGFFSIVRDVTERHAAERRVRFLHGLLRLQSGVHRLAAYATSRAEFVSAVCTEATDRGPFAMCWVGWKDPSGAVVPGAWAGHEAGYVTEIDVRWDRGPLADGPTGAAIRSGRTVVRPDLREDPSFAPWREAADRRGYRACASVPLRRDGDVVGALSAYLTDAPGFDQASVGALEELGAIVDLGLGRLAAWEDRRLAEAQLVRLATAVDQADEAVVITDVHGTIEYVNPAFSRITGWSADEAVGQTPRLLKSGVQTTAFYEELWRRLLRGESFAGRLVNHRKDGRDYLADVVISPVADAEKHVTHFVGLQRDVSDERELDAQLRYLQKGELLGQLTAGVAHDFNNLLGIVLANVALVSDATTLETKASALHDVEAAARAGVELVRKLLSIGRREPLVLRPFDVSAATRSAARMVARILPPQVTLETKVEPDLLALGDPGAFEQILVNLVTNARDAMPAGGTLRVHARVAPARPQTPDAPALSIDPGGFVDRIEVAVEDDGEGIPAAVLARVWEPFFTTKAPGKGTGLGLAMVSSLAGQLGGEVAIRSEPGVGTTVSLSLRRAASVAPGVRSMREATVPKLRGGGELVLLAEDDERMRRATVRSLERIGYRVLTAADGVEALAIWDEHARAVDLVVTDGSMPRLDGPGLVAALRARGATVPVLLVSGLSPEDRSEHLAPDPRVGTLPKPWTLAELDAAMRALLDGGADPTTTPPAHGTVGPLA